MAISLAVIVCPIVFGILFISQTAYFLYKILKSRRIDVSGKTAATNITMTDSEATCCMGWAWTSCIDRTTNTITLKTFIAWYAVAVSADIIVTLVFYFLLDKYYRYV
jgi:hypothetical protein